MQDCDMESLDQGQNNDSFNNNALSAEAASLADFARNVVRSAKQSETPSSIEFDSLFSASDSKASSPTPAQVGDANRSGATSADNLHRTVSATGSPTDSGKANAPKPADANRPNGSSSDSKPPSDKNANSINKNDKIADPGKPNDTTKQNDKPKADQKTEEAEKPKSIEVARGVNDLGKELGQGAKLERHDTGDTLTFSNGSKVRVVKGVDGISVTEIEPKGFKEHKPFLNEKDPYVKLKDGTTIKFKSNGQLEAVRLPNGKTFRFESPKF